LELFVQARAAKVPLAHTLQGVQAAWPPAEKVAPGAHAAHALAPAAAALPGPQRPQTASRVLEQAALGAKPAPQTVQAAHE